MNFLFGKKEMVPAMAEVLVDAEKIANEEMKKPRYKNYRGAEVMVDVMVRVQPANEPSFETLMKASTFKTFLLKPGVKVKVQYNQKNRKECTLDDEVQAILDRNPQLKKN